MVATRGFLKTFFRFFRRYIEGKYRYIWSVLVGMGGFFLSKSIYFDERPVFNFTYLGEAIIAAIFFLLTYFYGPSIVKLIGSWFEKIFVEKVNRILQDFWKHQTRRLVEAIKRENVIKELKPLKYKNVVLDTSAVIDGRIIGVIKTGFLDGIIIVPQNVIDELHRMADKSNDLKRQKGRIGLDRLRDIKKAVGRGKFKVVALKTKPQDVDRSLVRYCKKTNSKIATVDYNLNKAAQIAGVTVLNVNKLANEVKTNILPGDVLSVKFVQGGKEKNQAVGYLEDGTMIVVNEAKHLVGKYKDVTVIKVLQTSAGKMIFASLGVEK